MNNFLFSIDTHFFYGMVCFVYQLFLISCNYQYNRHMKFKQLLLPTILNITNLYRIMDDKFQPTKTKQNVFQNTFKKTIIWQGKLRNGNKVVWKLFNKTPNTGEQKFNGDMYCEIINQGRNTPPGIEVWRIIIRWLDKQIYS